MIHENQNKLRASAAWLHELCPASWHQSRGIPSVTEAGGPAEAGTFKHAGVREAVETGNDEAIPEGLGRWVAWIKEFRAIDYQVQFEIALEVPIANWIVTGHPDVIITRGPVECVIGDLKTGRVALDPADENLQLSIYAMMVSYATGHACGNTAAGDPDHDVIQGVIYQRPEFGAEAYSERTEPFCKADIAAVRQRVARIILRIEREPATYNVGGHCAYCPAMRTCPAVAPAIRTAADSAPVDLFSATPEQRAEIAGMVRLAKAFGAAGDKALKNWASISGDAIVIGNEQLGFVEHEQDAITISKPALDYLLDRYGALAYTALDSSKAALERVAVATASSAMHRLRVIDDLRALGAITKGVVTKFEWRKINKSVTKGEIENG